MPPSFITVTAPTDGATYQAGSNGLAAPVDVNGSTDPNTIVRVILNSGQAQWVATSDSGGNFVIPTSLPVGDNNVDVIAGAAGDSISWPRMVIHVLPFPHVAVPTDMSFTFYCNLIAGTLVDGVPQYSATRAVCIATNSPLDWTMAQALNANRGRVGANWQTVNACLNEIAGTTDMTNTDAAYIIALGGLQ